jgi:hypothetical protein
MENEPRKRGGEKKAWDHPALFSSPNSPVKKGHFLVGRMGSASNRRCRKSTLGEGKSCKGAVIVKNFEHYDRTSA